jgi:uncharacterized protein with PIN domain
MRRAAEMRIREGIPLGRALARVYEDTRKRVEKRLAVTAACSLSGRPLGDDGEAPRFVCDSSLGGLARWLRAAGYEAEWLVSGGAEELLRKAQAKGATLLTTDSRLLERSVIRGGEVRAEWLPSDLSRTAQLRMLMRDLSLKLRTPRCMSCGGELLAVAKEEVAARIPPKTARWKDDYFVCAGCDRLFWQGTHWERIARRLAELAS